MLSEAITGMVLGLSLIVLGLAPGLISRLVYGLQNAFENFLLFGDRYPRRPLRIPDGRLRGQGWFAVMGAALVALSFVALLTN